MISPSSLSAFSASVTNGGISATGNVQKARAQPKAPPQPPQSAAPQTTAPRPAPGTFTPRGTLLDLTV
jgi:hypothetical protein